MNAYSKFAGALMGLCLVAGAVAKLPAPVLTDEAKAKAAETAGKTAHAGKLDGYKLCVSMDKAAAHWNKTAKSMGKEAKPAIATPPCADPGAFVWPLPVAAAAAPTLAMAAAGKATPATKKP